MQFWRRTSKCNCRLQRYSYPTPGTKNNYLTNYFKFNTEQTSPLSCKKLRNNNTYLSYHHSACPVNASPCQVQSALLIVTPIVENLIVQSGVRCKVLPVFFGTFVVLIHHTVSQHCVLHSVLFFFGWTFTTPLFFTYCWPLGWHLGRVPTMKPVQPPKPIFAHIPKHIVGCLADCNLNRVPETLNYHGLCTFQCRPGKQPHHKKRHQIFRRTQLQGHGVDGCPGVLLLQWLWRGILWFLRLNTAWFHCLPWFETMSNLFPSHTCNFSGRNLKG